MVNQTLKEIEIICINDCTPDNSFEIVKEYAAKDSRFVLIEHEINQGQGIARNNGVAIARGEYICFVDPDDWIEPNMCDVLYNHTHQYNADFVEFLYFTNYEQSSVIKLSKFRFRFPQNRCFNWSQMNHRYPFSVPLAPWARFYKTDFIRKHNIAFANGTLAEDQIFAVKCRILANNICACKQRFYHYLIRKNSSCNIDIAPEKACNRIKLLNEIKSFLVENGSYDTLYNSFWQYAVDKIILNYQRISNNYKQSFEDSALQFIPEKYHAWWHKNKNSYYKNLAEKLFSVKNLSLPQGRFKVLTVLGIKIKLKKRVRGQR